MPFTNKRVAALVDVDNTLICDNGNGKPDSLNENLIEALSKSGIIDIYLFTNMTLGKEAGEMVANPGWMSRETLIQELQKREFTVHGVLTPSDVAYKKELNGLGAAYRDFIEPQCRRVLKKELDTQYSNDAAYKTAFDAIEKYHQTTRDVYKAERFSDIKGPLARYFLENKPEWVSSYIVIDDREECLIAACEANERSEKKLFLTTIRVDKRCHESVGTHLERISKHQAPSGEGAESALRGNAVVQASGVVDARKENLVSKLEEIAPNKSLTLMEKSDFTFAKKKLISCIKGEKSHDSKEINLPSLGESRIIRKSIEIMQLLESYHIKLDTIRPTSKGALVAFESDGESRLKKAIQGFQTKFNNSQELANKLKALLDDTKVDENELNGISMLLNQACKTNKITLKDLVFLEKRKNVESIAEDIKAFMAKSGLDEVRTTTFNSSLPAPKELAE